MTAMAAAPSPKRVLFLEHNTDGTVGGSHFCLLDICRELNRARFTPVVWFYQDNALIEDFRALDAEVHIHAPLKPFKFAATLRESWVGTALLPFQAAANIVRGLLVSALKWRRVLRDLRIDIVHLNNSVGDDHDLVLAARSLGLPCVAHQRGFPRPLRRLDRLMVRLVSRVVAISSAVRDDLHMKGVSPAAITLIHDGISADRVVPEHESSTLRTKLGIEPEQPVIGIVGNVKRWKGQHVVVRALPAILQAHPRTQCLMVGAIADPSYKAELDADITALGLQGHVHFLGYQKRPIDYTSLMDVVVHASIEPEPFGIVILEGMVLRKPIIATSIGGPIDIVLEGETGYLTQPSDPAALARKVISLLGDREQARRMGESGYARFLDLFSAATNAREIERLYLSLCDRQSL